MTIFISYLESTTRFTHQHESLVSALGPSEKLSPFKAATKVPAQDRILNIENFNRRNAFELSLTKDENYMGHVEKNW